MGDLPCGGCHYCTPAHKQWARFNDDVDDVVPLAIRSVEAAMPDQAMPEHQVVSNWVENLSSIELRRAQTHDPSIGIVMNWLEHSYEPTVSELQLTGPETRAMWLTRYQFKDGVLYYIWTNVVGRSDCLIVPEEIQTSSLIFLS